MARVDVLVKGYYFPQGTGGRACSTVTLVEDDGLRIITDPGTLKDPGILIQELAKRNLSPQDIDVVFISHSHLDHYLYAGLFSKARILEYWGFWQGDSWCELPDSIGKDIKIIKTPGHSEDSISLLVKTAAGIIAICGDVFWDEDRTMDDPLASDPKVLAKTRKKLLDLADYIVPGHGDMFKV